MNIIQSSDKKVSRFLLYAGHLQRGGSFERARMLVRELLQKGCEVLYVGARRPKLEEHPLLQLRVPTPPRVPKRSLRARAFYAVALPWRLFILLVSRRYRALVVFDPRLSLFVWLPTALLGVPTLLFLRSIPSSFREESRARRSSLLGRYHERLGLYFASTVVVTTVAMKEYLARHSDDNPGKLVVVPSGIIYPRSVVAVDSEAGAASWVGSEGWEQWLSGFSERRRAVCERFGVSEKSFLMVTAGELTLEKNVEALIRGLGASELENIVLIVSGDGPEAQRVFGVAVSYGMSERVIMAGWMKDPLEVITGCDLYVSPSESLDIPNSVMEALGAGIPTIAGNTSAMKEWLKYDELVYERNHVGRLSSRLREITKTKAVYEQIKKLSHQRALELDTSWDEGIGSLITQISS